MIDESHATVPQIGGMYDGDRSRKTVLVDYGFRLPSALDNRPLNFEEFQVLAEPDDLRQRHARPARAGMVRGPASSSRSSGPPAWWTRRSPSSR